MELQEAITELQKHGFQVNVSSWSLGDPTLAVGTVDRDVPRNDPDYIIAWHNVSWIYFREGHWGFTKRESSGTPPTNNEVDYPTAKLAEAVTALLNYYFGEPIELDGWIIPLHKHPEWDRDRLHIAIEKAQRVSMEEWQAIYDEHRQTHQSKLLMEGLPFSFVGIFHSQITDVRLELRRDLNQAFVVSA